MAKERAQTIMAMLGLAGCSETIIGDHTHRGVSGGERRRVTLAELMLGEYSVACFDEISNGLDSAVRACVYACGRLWTVGFGRAACVLTTPTQPDPT